MGSAPPSHHGATLKLAVVIPNYNGRHLLETCLPTVFADLDGIGAEVLVVDNNSSDGSVQWLRSAWPAVTVIVLDTNHGYGAACNAGADASHAPVLIFHNNDATVQAGWSAALRTTLKSAPDVVIAGGLTLFRSQPERVNSAGIRIAMSGAAIDNGFGRPVQHVDLTERDVAGVSGVSMAVKRDWFRAIGGFDESFSMYFEDADLCLRAWVAGQRVRFTPNAIVLHAFGGTSGERYTTLRNYYGSRNRLLLAAKSFGPSRFILAITLSVVEDLAVVVWLILTLKFNRAGGAARGKLRGTLAALQVVPRYIRRSKPGPHSRSPHQLRRLGIIDPLPVSIRHFAYMRVVSRTR